ncbi:carbohydrate ABC transporter permease [Vibrio methylphosphonaticus]|uniref:carbohydrate ABC transporter permease n=1 Tax=Vibrio methylphosphonaticus TaxID=2946866 RepID=UPI002029FE12|nr:sugar ABC transporter permease [Vibrio methylphosphonaticus]MCL9775660.1 sugar ABC transporter permease [Vibrio methylphosphonaticus]
MKKLTPYFFVLPCILLIGIFTYWPIVSSFFYSFHSWNFLSSDMPFVGLDNYRYLLEGDEFKNSLIITLIFVVVSVPIRLGLALFLANFLVTETKLVRFLRGAYFLPSVTSTVAISVIWSWIFATDFGLINSILAVFGVDKVTWLQSPMLALWVIIIVNTWKQLGYDMVIYVAGLQAIPKELYEASQVDGGKKLHVFRRVTFPLVMPTTYFLLIISVVESFQIFTIVNVMTNGGPAFATDMLVNLLYRTGFELFDIGQGSALAVILFVILLALAVVKSKLIGKKVHYEGR